MAQINDQYLGPLGLAGGMLGEGVNVRPGPVMVELVDVDYRGPAVVSPYDVQSGLDLGCLRPMKYS